MISRPDETLRCTDDPWPCYFSFPKSCPLVAHATSCELWRFFSILELGTATVGRMTDRQRNRQRVVIVKQSAALAAVLRWAQYTQQREFPSERLMCCAWLDSVCAAQIHYTARRPTTHCIDTRSPASLD